MVTETLNRVFIAAADNIAGQRPPNLEVPGTAGLFTRLADDPGHPLAPLARSLRDRSWSAPLAEIAQQTDQNPDKIRKIASLLPGVLIIDGETLSLVQPQTDPKK